MSFFIRNKTSGAIAINDLGLTIPAGVGSPPQFDYDLITEDPRQIAVSADLIAQIVAGNIVVLDPLDGTTELSAAVSQEIVEVHNDPHYRIRGGTLTQLEDVDTTGCTGGCVLTYNDGDAEWQPNSPSNIAGDIRLGDLEDVNTPSPSGSPSGTWENNTVYVLVGNGSDEVTATPLFSSGSPSTPIPGFCEAVQDISGAMIAGGSQTDITVNYVDGAGTCDGAVNFSIDDVFLRNTGDTLDSGTLTIASGAGISIVDGASALIETPTGGFTNNNDIVNKAYVDNIAAGLKARQSVNVATPDDLDTITSSTWTYASGSGSPSEIGSTLSATATGSPIQLTIDGVALSVGDRVLVKGQEGGSPDRALENGIYTVTADGTGSPAQWVLTRCTCTDESSEVSGAYTFVESGNTYENSAWILSVDDPSTFVIGQDPIIPVQFSGAGAFVGDIGIAQTGTVFALDLGPTEVASATPALADRIAFHDVTGSAQGVTGTQTYGATFQEVFNALDVVNNITSDGFVVRTAADTYASRTIVAAGAGDRDGLEVLNGDGIAGNPTVGLDIEGLPLRAAVDTVDRVAVWDSSTDTNVYYTVSDIAGAIASTNSFENWAGGGNTTGDAQITADSSTDTATLAGGTGINVNVSAATDTLTISLDFSTIPAGGSPSVVDGTDEIVINNGGTLATVTLQEVIDQLGLDTDELIKVSANDTTPGYLDGKLIAGTYTTLTQNNDGGNETLTVDVDLSAIKLEDIGNVNLQGSPAPADGDVLVYRAGSPAGWTNENLDAITAPAFGTVTGDSGSAAADVAGDTIAIVGGTAITTVAADDPETLTISLDFTSLPTTSGSPGATPSGNTEIIINEGGTVYTTTLNELVSNTITGGNGINVTTVGSPATLEISLDVCGMSAGDVANLDFNSLIPVCDGSNTVSYSLGDIFEELDVVSGVTGSGIVVKTGGSPDSYATRDIQVAGAGAGDGLAVTNGDGIAGNPTLELDIDGTPSAGENMTATDQFIGYNTSSTANEKFTGQEIADGVANILGLSSLSVKAIGGSGSPGEFQLFMTDPARSKDLSTAEFSVAYSENNLGNNDWMEVGSANDATSGYIIPYNATLVRATAHTANSSNAKGIDLYVDGTATAPLITIPSGGGGQANVADGTLNVDVNAGQKIRLRGASTGGTIGDVIVTLWFRWRA